MHTTNLNKGPILKDDLIKIKKIIDIVEQDPQSFDFLEPVDYVGLDDYPKIIKNPMDLGTVGRKIDSLKYTSMNEIVNDIQLIWDNCRTYNMEGSDIYKMAIHCEKLFKRAYEKFFKLAVTQKQTSSNIFINLELNEPMDREVTGEDLISLSEKMNFTDKVRKLSNEVLAMVIKLIERECPQAIEDVDSEKFHIKVDLLDKRCLEQIYSFLDTMSKLNELPNNENVMSNKKK